MVSSLRLVLPPLLALPAPAALAALPTPPPAPPTSQGGQTIDPTEVVYETAPYDGLTDRKTDWTNFNPEPMTGLCVDADFRIWAVNPYASTIVGFDGVGPAPTLVAPTCLNPVSIACWEPTASPEDRRIIAVCVGTHVAVLHRATDGTIEAVVKLDSEPGDIVIDPDDDSAYVSCQGSNSVLRIDLATFEVVDRYHIPVGQRPGPLYLDRGPNAGAADNRVYVAPMVTGNNSIPFSGPAFTKTAAILDLEGHPGGELPDHDVFRINPGNGQVDPVVKKGGSLQLDIGRNSDSGDLWILSSRSDNKSAATEPELCGDFAMNQLKIVAGVDASSSLLTAGDGLDLDDHDWSAPGSQYDAAKSLNQARYMAFHEDNGMVFVGGPHSDVIVALKNNGKRLYEFQLPPGSQCYSIEMFDPDQRVFLALCLGDMTVKAFSWLPPSPDPIATFDLGRDYTPPQIKRGRDVFLDGSRSQDSRFGCYSCHLGARSDQLVWGLSGEPCDVKDIMLTQTLMGIDDLFPYHWRGERKLLDFRKAFGGLLCAAPEDVPTEQEMDDLVEFFRSLQLHSNPVQNLERIVDDARTPDPIRGFTPSAVNGQEVFQSVPNFNSNTCVECHVLETGSNGNMFAEVFSLVTRAQEVEVAHLRALEPRGRETVDVTIGAATVTVNQDGSGLAHNATFPNLEAFVFGFQDLTEQERADTTAFVHQWDQGIAPGAHHAELLEQGSPGSVKQRINRVLLQGAKNGWIDTVAFGEYDDGGGTLLPTRWLYDPGQTPPRFVADRPGVAPLTWNQLKNETEQGLARNVVVGVPPGNGQRFGLDHDDDGLVNGDEVAAGTDPWNPDTDDDGWPDGYEVTHGDDPLTPQLISSDATAPTLVASSELFSTARLSKVEASFDEPVTFVVSYATPGGPVRTFERKDFKRCDTFVLRHSEPSTPGLAPLTFNAEITMTDRAGNVTGPVALASFQPMEVQHQGDPPNQLQFVHIDEIEWLQQDRVGDRLDATVRVKVASNSGAPGFDAIPDHMVYALVAVSGPDGTFDQSDDFVVPPTTPTAFDFLNPLSGQVENYAIIDGPFLVFPDTDASGVTTLSFSQPGLQAGQTVKVSIMGVLPALASQPGVYDGAALPLMQPLLLEDAHELRLVF